MNEYDSYKNSCKYQSGFCYGYLLGCTEATIKNIQIISETETEPDLLGIPTDYYEEIISIINKYPSYSLEHQAKKVIFESTHLPYY